MQIDDAAREGVEQRFAHDTHISREAYKLHSELVEAVGYHPLEIPFRRIVLRTESKRRHPEARGALKHVGARLVAYTQGYLCIYAPVGTGFGKSLEIAPVAAGEYRYLALHLLFQSDAAALHDLSYDGGLLAVGLQN